MSNILPRGHARPQVRCPGYRVKLSPFTYLCLPCARMFVAWLATLDVDWQQFGTDPDANMRVAGDWYDRIKVANFNAALGCTAEQCIWSQAESFTAD